MASGRASFCHSLALRRRNSFSSARLGAYSRKASTKPPINGAKMPMIQPITWAICGRSSLSLYRITVAAGRLKNHSQRFHERFCSMSGTSLPPGCGGTSTDSIPNSRADYKPPPGKKGRAPSRRPASRLFARKVGLDHPAAARRRVAPVGQRALGDEVVQRAPAAWCCPGCRSAPA